jgi:GntR family transcriptional regulator
MTTVELDASSPVPPFEQLRSQLEELIRSGALVTGAQLPTVRQLAADLAVAPGTVARAYQELEAAGLVAGQGRRGTVVTGAPTPARERRRLLREAAARYLDEARRLGLGEDAALAEVQRLLGRA